MLRRSDDSVALGITAVLSSANGMGPMFANGMGPGAVAEMVAVRLTHGPDDYRVQPAVVWFPPGSQGLSVAGVLGAPEWGVDGCGGGEGIVHVLVVC
jgi:hypothetical protein